MNQSIENVCWDVNPAATVDEITRWCLDNRGVDRLFVVARPDNDAPGTLLEPRVEAAVAKMFGTKVIRALWARAWAGTELFRRRAAKVWIIAFDEDVRTRMVAVQNSLSGWRHANNPPLPEDICLYRVGDALPTFVSVTHDSEAWLFDSAARNATFAERAELPLPADLIPARPDFVVPS
jgi:hypothetical protein